jgi:hypothetical protein
LFGGIKAIGQQKAQAKIAKEQAAAAGAAQQDLQNRSNALAAQAQQFQAQSDKNYADIKTRLEQDDAQRRAGVEAILEPEKKKVNPMGLNVFTSPLGDTSTASTGRRRLLGG